MTGGQLAVRMGLSQPAVTQLERSEVAGRAHLDTLRRAAEALDCDFVYALVPRTSLEETVHARAVELATRDLGPDAADADPEVLARRIDHNAARLVAGSRLWDDHDAD